MEHGTAFNVEEQRLQKERAAKRRKWIITIVALFVTACVVCLIVLVTAIIPNKKYNNAVKLYEEGRYDEAIAAFETMEDYKDSATFIKECKYSAALDLAKNGDIVNAFEDLLALNGFKDSAEKAAEIAEQGKLERLRAASVGDIVFFGNYEQNSHQGKEAIEWLVLAKDELNLLVISKYALDTQPFDSSDYYQFTGDRWDSSDLRKWLNSTFLSEAFSGEEKLRIRESLVTADMNPAYDTSPGNDTYDRIFLLSAVEAQKYFHSDEARKCALTDYAFRQGAMKDVNDFAGGKGTCDWWLRSPGYIGYNTAIVDSSGTCRDKDSQWGGTAIRPAMWIYIGT